MAKLEDQLDRVRGLKVKPGDWRAARSKARACGSLEQRIARRIARRNARRKRPPDDFNYPF